MAVFVENATELAMERDEAHATITALRERVADLEQSESPGKSWVGLEYFMDMKTRATAAEAAIARLRDEVEWKPIETAPKDGLLLLACADWGHSTVLGKPVPVKVGGWWDGRWNVFGASWTPTHWMPLPAAPLNRDTHHETR